jgi:hypothetical protein
MARFRGTIQGCRGEASRLGGTETGIETRTNGWNSGVRVVGFVDDNGDDCFDIYITGGSNGSISSQHIKRLDAKTMKRLKKKEEKKTTSWVKTVGTVAMMGELLAGPSKAEKNDWKARMLKAGLGEGIHMPEDWDSLSEDEKERRLNGGIDALTKEPEDLDTLEKKLKTEIKNLNFK